MEEKKHTVGVGDAAHDGSPVDARKMDAEAMKSILFPIPKSKYWHDELGMPQQSDSDLTITQEFIEGFGFTLDGDKDGFRSYKKSIIDPDTDLKSFLYLTCNSDGECGLFTEGRDVIFSGYTCHTQSELRFLLTRGRVDVSQY